MPGDIRVSILTPSFDQARWLVDNLRSVSAQSYKNLEHIVMDGGSTDGSVEILAQHRDSRLQWQSEPDRGQSHALNKAFALSTGEIIGWLNSDDAYVDRRAVEWAVEAFAAHPEIDVVYGNAVLASEDSAILQYIWTGPSYQYRGAARCPIVQPSAFVRRRALSDGFVLEDFEVVMDAELWLRLSTAGCRFLHVSSLFALDRHQPSRKVYTLGARHHEERLELAERYGHRWSWRERIIGRVENVRQRLQGVIHILRVERLVDPATTLRTDAPWRRLLRQIAIPRRKMEDVVGKTRVVAGL